MLRNMGAGEWALVLLVIVLLFGAKKLPELARGAGQGWRIFKSEVKDDNNDAALEAGEKKPEQQD